MGPDPVPALPLGVELMKMIRDGTWRTIRSTKWDIILIGLMSPRMASQPDVPHTKMPRHSTHTNWNACIASEITDSKDAEDGKDSHELPIDYDHDNNFHGHYFLPDLEEVDDLRHETNPVTAVTCSINRIERGASIHPHSIERGATIVSLDGSWSCPGTASGSRINHSICRPDGRQTTFEEAFSNTPALLNENRDLDANVPCRSSPHSPWCITRFWCSTNIEESRCAFCPTTMDLMLSCF